MASNSGLYEDSDDESWTNELSPTDGYFSQRPSHPQDVLVPDPLQNSADANKAREAREEREADATSEASATLRSESQATHNSSSSRRRLDPDFEDETTTEHTQLIPSAPPAYSAASADRQYSPPESNTRGSAGNAPNRAYNTMRRSPIFLSDGHPTDFGEVPLLSDTDHRGPAWKRRARSCLPRTWRSCAIFTVIFIALLIGVGFIASVLSNVQFKWEHNRDHPHPVPDSDKMEGSPPSSCPSATRIGKASFTFLGPDFTFSETIKTQPGARRRRVRTMGELHVRSSTEHLEANVRLDLEIHYSEPGMMKEIGFVPHEESLSMFSPSHIEVESGTSSNPCMYFVGTLWIAPGARFDFLSISSQSMTIIFHDGIDVDAEGLGVDATGANSVAFPTGNSKQTNIDSRKIVISTSSGSIRGTYPLYDLLEAKSRSGSITIDITPKEASSSDPQPATLYLSTMSGTIQSNTPFLATNDRDSLASLVPARDYRTTISSMSGALRITTIHGSQTVLKSTTGSIVAELSPYGDPDDKSQLTTSAETGSTTVTVLPSLSHPGEALRNFYAAYKVNTGSLVINYPREWEGTVQGTTVTGSINVNWPGLEIESWGGRKTGWSNFKGVKGHGEGRLEFHGVTGSVSLNG
ncbi:hypothetical protein MMC30_005816 [Trapelia coarctata]|nr:hypothetical protein [Trapelia coarctata]